VIVDVQRLGPSTGSPTKGADGDIQFLRWGNSGGLPVVVLAPSSVEDCHSLTVEAFNLADTYRCPVFLAANKEIAMTRETVDISGLKTPEIRNRKMADDQHGFLPFGVSGNRLVPDFLPIGSRTPVRQTSSTHGPDGYISTDPEAIGRAQARRMKKLRDAVESFTFYDWLPAAGARTLLICYGVTGRAARRAVEELLKENVPVSLLLLKTLWPVPEHLLRDLCSKHERVVVVEMNLGQYVREIERLAPGRKVSFSGRMDGELIAPGEIKEALRKETLLHG
jgi:2-oxoglutarate ferredoxin oxidoreductase subunit alpha